MPSPRDVLILPLDDALRLELTFARHCGFSCVFHPRSVRFSPLLQRQLADQRPREFYNKWGLLRVAVFRLVPSPVSAVSAPIFWTKGSLCSIFRALQDYLYIVPDLGNFQDFVSASSLHCSVSFCQLHEGKRICKIEILSNKFWSSVELMFSEFSKVSQILMKVDLNFERHFLKDDQRSFEFRRIL